MIGPGTGVRLLTISSTTDDTNTIVTDTEIVVDNISEEVTEIEKHIHNREKWFGLAASAVGETHVADRMGGATDPFQLIAGNSDFGAWVQVLGSVDTPAEVGKTLFDAHRAMITDTNSIAPYIIQIAAGESAGLAALIATEMFTEFPYVSGTNNNDSGISDVLTIRAPAGTKVWARAACIGANATTIDLYFGIHEYEA